MYFQTSLKKRGNLRKSKNGYKNFHELLPKFAEKGVFSLSKFGCDEKDLDTTFETKTAVYHRQCYLEYDQQHYDRLVASDRKRKENEGTKTAHQNEEPQASACKQPKRKPISLGEVKCYICELSDNSEELHAAGAWHATAKKVDREHLRKYTKKMRVIASYLELNHIVSRLSSGDVASNELFYHASCYKQLCNNYQSKKNEDAKSISTQVNGQEDFVKALAFNKILTYVREGISAGEC